MHSGERRLRPHDGIGGGDGRPPSRLPDSGSARTGQPSRVGQFSDTAGDSALCDHGPPAMISPRSLDGLQLQRSVAGRNQPARDRDDHFRTLTARGVGAGRAGEGLPELPGSVTGPGRRAPWTRYLEGPDPRGPTVGFLAFDGTPRTRPNGQQQRTTRLVDRLRRAGVMELSGPDRRADDEAQPGRVRLDDGRHAARVPLVTQMMVGLPCRHGQPEAKNAPLRSSRRTWTRRRSAKAARAAWSANRHRRRHR